MLTFTSSVDSLASDCERASCEPCTSALIISGRDWTSPICSNMFSSLAACAFANFTSRNLPGGTGRFRALCVHPPTPWFPRRQAAHRTSQDLDRIDGRLLSPVCRFRPAWRAPGQMTRRRAEFHCTQCAGLNQDRRDGPRPLSKRDSITKPFAGNLAGHAKPALPLAAKHAPIDYQCPDGLGDTSTNIVSPPHSSGTTPCAESSCFTRSEFASGLSILFTATRPAHCRPWHGAQPQSSAASHRHRRNDQDHDICRFGATRTHRSKRFVARVSRNVPYRAAFQHDRRRYAG